MIWYCRKCGEDFHGVERQRHVLQGCPSDGRELPAENAHMSVEEKLLRIAVIVAQDSLYSGELRKGLESIANIELPEREAA